MNLYALVILAALLVEHALSAVADLLNLRHLRPELPAEFEGVYDAQAYRRSQEYTVARTRFGLIPGTFDLILLLAFWGLGGFGWLDGALRGLGYGSVLTGLLFVGSLVIARGVLHLPFQLYSTFVIEERFGFNRTTPGTFAVDLIKGLALGALLAGPLLAAVLWLFESAGSWAWLACWGFTALFLVAVQLVAPTWILPLFNKFQPLQEGELRRALLEYAGRVGFPLDDVYVVDGSRRSSKANAFFTGFGKNKRVALFDTLIEKHSEEELVAVVAHEIGHYKRRHIQKGLALSILHLGVLFGLLQVFLSQDGLFEAFGAQPSVYAGLVFFGLLYTPIEMVLSVALNRFSRHNEFEADEFSASTTRAPETLIQALKRLSLDNLSNLTPHPFFVWLHYSHPPVLERIRALRSASDRA
jgi:STE24 endopeptidase